MWYAGLDWADSHHDIVVIDETGHHMSSRRVAHTAEGLAELIVFLQGIAPLDQIACIIETNHGLLMRDVAGSGLYDLPGESQNRRSSSQRFWCQDRYH